MCFVPWPGVSQKDGEGALVQNANQGARTRSLGAFPSSSCASPTLNAALTCLFESAVKGSRTVNCRLLNSSLVAAAGTSERKNDERKGPCLPSFPLAAAAVADAFQRNTSRRSTCVHRPWKVEEVKGRRRPCNTPRKKHACAKHKFPPLSLPRNPASFCRSSVIPPPPFRLSPLTFSARRRWPPRQRRTSR